MRRQTRRNVFETNSSSCHSFTIENGRTVNNLVVEDDGYVHTELGEFGWEIEDYYDSATKLAYILLVAAHFVKCNFWSFYSKDFDKTLISFKETDLYKEIEEVVKLEMNCKGIIIDKDSEGYIDHQSLEQDSFEEWMKEAKASSIREFIFGNIILHTDNDNH